MILIGKIKFEDREALSRIYHSKDWEVVVRIFGENEREIIHREMENTTSMEDLAFAQGRIAGVKKLIKGIAEAGKSFEKEDEDEQENTTTYNG